MEIAQNYLNNRFFANYKLTSLLKPVITGKGNNFHHFIFGQELYAKNYLLIACLLF
jgi:hypothetical protein